MLFNLCQTWASLSNISPLAWFIQTIDKLGFFCFTNQSWSQIVLGCLSAQSPYVHCPWSPWRDDDLGLSYSHRIWGNLQLLSWSWAPLCTKVFWNQMWALLTAKAWPILDHSARQWSQIQQQIYNILGQCSTFFFFFLLDKFLQKAMN